VTAGNGEGEASKLVRAEAARKLVRSLFAAWDRRDFDEYVRLLHPEARLHSVRGGDLVTTPEDVGGQLEEAAQEPFFLLVSGEPLSLDEAAVVVAGTIRAESGLGGHTVTQYVWLFTIADDRIFRIRAMHTADEARALYDREGLTLGM
jgi:ketosteroid isomerase-like protein